MWLLDWRLALISLGLIPIFALLTYKVGRARREITTSTQRTMADLTSILEETLSVSGVLLTKAFGRQRFESDKFRNENDLLMRSPDPTADDRALVSDGHLRPFSRSRRRWSI